MAAEVWTMPLAARKKSAERANGQALETIETPERGAKHQSAEWVWSVVERRPIRPSSVWYLRCYATRKKINLNVVKLELDQFLAENDEWQYQLSKCTACKGTATAPSCPCLRAPMYLFIMTISTVACL